MERLIWGSPGGSALIDRVSDYDLLEVLERGETAFLYKGRDRRDGSLVVVEVFSPDVTPEEVREHRRGATVGQISDGRFFVVRAVVGTDADTTVLEIPRGFTPGGRPADLEPSARPAGREGGRVAHYLLQEQLGRGGMGVVYRAEDSRLRRTVALKFLPSGLTRDLASKARFLQEAQAASALDHPNICTIYEVGETDTGELYLAMACYDGETVQAKIKRGPLPATEAVDLARQAAQGLAKAHRHGIVHRDIKPANLMVTEDGVVKILDFGIAKLLSADLSLAGELAGTPAYMSPEQARGEEVCARTDVWSLGVVLHEMLTGTRPLEGRQRVSLPKGLEPVLETMLAQSPADRYPTAAETLADLTAFQDALTAVRNTRRAVLWAAAAALAASVLATGIWLSRREEPPLQGTFSRLTDQEGREEYPSLSPDGSSIVYVRTVSGQRDLYLQRAGGGGNPVLLTPGSPEDDTQPAFSPDGREIAFRSEREGGGIYRVSASGGVARRITDFGYNPTWSPDGREIAFATDTVVDPTVRSPDSRIWRVDLESGHRRLVVQSDGVQPSWSPHGWRIAYWGISAGHDGRILWTVPVNGGAPSRALDDGFLNWNPVWSPDGTHLYFGSDRNGSFNLWRLSIDERSGKVLGKPQAVTASSQAIGFWSFSMDGRRVVYAANQSKSNIERFPFDSERVKVTGPGVSITRGSQSVRSCDVSPDGRLIAFHAGFPQEDLFVVRADGSGDPRRLTNDRYKDRHPFWSPDGQRLLFYSNRRGSYEAWIIRPDGSGLEPILKESGKPIAFPIWAPDGKRLACIFDEKAAVIDLTQRLEERAPSFLPPVSLGGERFFPTSWSPDSERLAGNMSWSNNSSDGVGFFSFKSGTFEALTTRGGDPFWMRDSQRVFFFERGAIFAIDARTKQIYEVLAPGPNDSFRMVSLSPNLRSLFVVRSAEEGDIWQLRLPEGKGNF